MSKKERELLNHCLDVLRLMLSGRKLEQAIYDTCPIYLGKSYREKVKGRLFSEGWISMDSGSMYWGVTSKGMEAAGF